MFNTTILTLNDEKEFIYFKKFMGHLNTEEIKEYMKEVREEVDLTFTLEEYNMVNHEIEENWISLSKDKKLACAKVAERIEENWKELTDAEKEILAKEVNKYWLYPTYYNAKKRANGEFTEEYIEIPF